MIYDFVCRKFLTKNLTSKVLFLAVIVSSLLFSCKKEVVQDAVTDNVLTILASATDVVLTPKKKEQTAIQFNWTTGSNQGTNSSISYTLQIDKKGNNFATPFIVDLGKGVDAQSYTHHILNDMALTKFKVSAGVTQELEAKIIATVGSDKSGGQSSNVITFKITPYTPVTSTLYIIGDATSTGWDANTAKALIPDANDPTRFTFVGTLNRGDFKFITTQGQFLPSYNKGANDSSVVLRTLDSQPDNKFTVTQTSVYTIVVDLVNLTISIQKQAGAPYSRLWVLGDAAPNGWDINNPSEMRVDSTDPFIFTYNEVLKAGEFKIPVATGDFGTDYYMPLTNHPPLTATSVQLVLGGNPDNKWEITTPGAYKITLNLRDLTISIKPFTPYTALGMVGDATPAGWNIDNPTPMVKDANNPYLFTYNGPLSAGEFKIPGATGNWGADFFMPVVNHPDLGSHLVKFVPGGNPDYKWQITSAGNYMITFNQLYETISIVKQ